MFLNATVYDLIKGVYIHRKSVSCSLPGYQLIFFPFPIYYSFAHKKYIYQQDSLQFFLVASASTECYTIYLNNLDLGNRMKRITLLVLCENYTRVNALMSPEIQQCQIRTRLVVYVYRLTSKLMFYGSGTFTSNQNEFKSLWKIKKKGKITTSTLLSTTHVCLLHPN